MKLLQILALLGHANQTASEGMYELLRSVMRRADSGTNIGYAVWYIAYNFFLTTRIILILLLSFIFLFLMVEGCL